MLYGSYFQHNLFGDAFLPGRPSRTAASPPALQRTAAHAHTRHTHGTHHSPPHPSPPQKTVFFGEISLSGQIRNVSHTDKRINEAHRLGFEKIIMPKLNKKQKDLMNQETLANINIVEISNILELIKIIKS